jgi:hypothetical protein
MRTKALTPLLVTAACALGLVPASAAAATNVQPAASQNWSGYVANTATGKRFSSVNGSWVAPAVTCTGGSSYSAFWVGLGGSDSSPGSAVSSAYGSAPGSPSGSGQSQALEQAGTEADCTGSGQAKYFAWYELVPAAPVKLGLTIKPGDHITTRVSVSGSTVTINLSDATSGQSVNKTLTMSNPDTSSAEWIAEAPSSCSQGATNCSPMPLANFGNVKFSNATATTSDGHTGSISDPAWTATPVALQGSPAGYGGPQFATNASSTGATPSGLSSNGGAFSVAWSNGGSSSATGVGATSGYGDGAGAPGSGYGGGSGDGGSSGSYPGYPGGGPGAYGGYPGAASGGYPGAYGGYPGAYGGYPGAYGGYPGASGYSSYPGAAGAVYIYSY